MGEPWNANVDLDALDLHELAARGRYASVEALAKGLGELGIGDDDLSTLLQRRVLRGRQHATIFSRVAMLRLALPLEVTRRVLQSTPAVLSLDLRATLQPKLDALEAATGLEAAKVVGAAPQLLLLRHEGGALQRRVDALQQALPGLDVPRLLERAPRLLGRDAQALQSALERLSTALPPSVAAESLVHCQPTLLGASVEENLAPKLSRLRELCIDSEWEQLTCPRGVGTLARALTASAGVIERLDVVGPVSEAHGARSVSGVLFMSRKRYGTLISERGLG